MLIELVIHKHMSVNKARKKLFLKYSTAKRIVHIFKEKGVIPGIKPPEIMPVLPASLERAD